jgi:type I restriction enzyme M protein
MSEMAIDVLLSSTGSGTLGKAAVWDVDHLAIAEDHITIIRPDPTQVDRYYLADYLRSGFGHDQIDRLYTGSTNLIELTTEHVNAVVVPLFGGTDEQLKLSKQLRVAEFVYQGSLNEANDSLTSARASFEEKTSG